MVAYSVNVALLATVLVAMIVSQSSGALIKRRSVLDDYEEAGYDSDKSSNQISQSDSSTRLLLKIYDVIIQDALERGATPPEIQSMVRKRSGLRKCFFHAVNCW